MNVALDTLARMWETLSSSLIDPASDPLAAVLGLAIIVLVLLIIIVMISAIVMGSPRRPEHDGLIDASHETYSKTARHTTDRAAKRKRDIIWTSILAGIVALVACTGVVYTSTDSFCGRCHYTEQAFESRDSGPHAEVACSACHEAGGVSTYLGAKARGLENLRTQIAGDVSAVPIPSVVADAACLHCHANVRTETVVARSIRVRHEDFLDVGYHCAECHNTEGHGQYVARARYPEMRYCITCHSASEQMSECSVCHPEDPGVAIRRSRRTFPKTNVVREDCRGCHGVQSCNECHGIELPHTRDFVTGYHAKWAYTDLEMCLSCHDMRKFCNDVGCHNFSVEQIVSEDGLRRVGWQHQELMDQHSGLTAQRCAGCHGDPDVCEYCHGELPEH